MKPTCEHCRFWNEGKPFTDYDISAIEKHGIGFNRHRCSHIDDLVNDPGYDTEGVETSHNFGCILFECKD